MLDISPEAAVFDLLVSAVCDDIAALGVISVLIICSKGYLFDEVGLLSLFTSSGVCSLSIISSLSCLPRAAGQRKQTRREMRISK